MSWVFWLVVYLVLVALVLLFFAGVSSSERFDADAVRRGGPSRMRPPKVHPSELPSQLELSLDATEPGAAPVRSRA